MDSLKTQISDLRQRNRELTELLRSQKSPLPFTPPRKWVGKLTSKSVSEAQLKIEVTKEKSANVKRPTKKKPLKNKKKSAKKTKPNSEPSSVKIVEIPSNSMKNTTKNAPLREINNTQANSSILTRTITLPCTTMSLVLSNTKTSLVTAAKPSLLAPIMATGIQPVLQRNPSLSTLGPGTLIMPDGRIMPVPPHPAPTVLTVVNSPASQPAVIVMQNLTPVKPVQKSQLRPIVPKLKRRDTTKTTFVNKVPIPAISTQRLSNFVSSSSVKTKTVQTKTGKKVVNKKKVVVNKEICEKSVSGNSKANEVAAVKPNDEKQQEVVKPTEKENSESIKIDKNIPAQINLEQNTKESNENDLEKEHNINSTKRKSVEDNESIENSKRQKSDDSNITINSSNNGSIPKNTNEISKPDDGKYLANEQYTSENVQPLEQELNISKEVERENASAPTTIVVLKEKETIEIIDNQNNISAENKKGCTLGNPNNGSIINIETEMTNNKNVPCEIQRTNEKSTVEKTNISTEDANKNITENVKNLPLQNSKSTQISSGQSNCQVTAPKPNEPQNVPQNISSGNEKKDDSGKTNTIESKDMPLPKSVIQDDSQELTNLFPTDPKLQSCPENLFKDTDFRDRNLFMPIGHSYMDEVRLSLPHSDFSNDLFSSLQVPTGGQHPESISPTAAFLLAFPLVTTSKTSELIAETEAGDSQHATPTTILQIGNIDPPGNDLYHQTSLTIENNVNNMQDTMKINKPCDNVKNDTTKQMKGVEHYNKFQQMEMNELIRNENFSRSNCKEKKTFTGLQEQDLFLSCNKKRSTGRTCDYPMQSESISHFLEKPFEFPPNNVRHNNSVQNPPVNQGRQVASTNNLKKNLLPPENIMQHQNTYNVSSQPYSYNSFTSGHEFSLPNSNYVPTNRSTNETSKPTHTSSNFNSISWQTSSVTTTTNCNDYSTPYCAYPQKTCTNPPNKNVSQKLQQNHFEDQRLKEKSTSTNNSLPKFSSNFQFNNRSNQDIHNYPQTNQTENINYKIETKTKKQKTNSQRPPVNWMTTPDIRPVLPDPNIAPILPDVMFQPQKELDFNSAANNPMLNTSNNITPFNISSSVSNNPQTFYPNSHFSGIDFQLDFAPFPEITSNKPPRTSATVSNCQQNPHHYSWSPSKSSIPLLPHIENHMIPSTLPTLVGDLALGTTTPSGPIDAFKNLSMPTTPFNIENQVKKCDPKHDVQKSITSKSPEKVCFSTTERRNSNRNMIDYCQQKTHSHQSTNTTSSFLSVSQLVDQVKSEQNSSRRAGKQSVASKNSANIQKRNMSNHQTDKTTHNKMTNNMTIANYHPSNTINPVMTNQRKPDIQSVYQDNHNTGVGFNNNVGPPPWQNNKTHRSSHYKGSYSAESLIGEPAPSAQDHTSELPPFSMANQYNHTTIVSSASYLSADFSHQNVQPLEFHQHQNCFNFPTHNSHYSSTSFLENDYHVGLDPLYNFNPSSRSSTSCQTSHGVKDSRTVPNKRNPSAKRREEFPPPQPQFLQTSQVYPMGARAKCPPPPTHCPTTSSPSHQGTTSLTNFNLSTIFPEINDKRAVQGTNSFHPSVSKHSEPTGRPPDYFNPNLTPQMQQLGIPAPPNVPSASFTNLGPPAGNFRPQ
ncbi:hypothetical protein J6590_064409 [Homalodisca vitripennis]|nr:hypothetical protein J6590_064409 [Homalodisca vitripennis]